MKKSRKIIKHNKKILRFNVFKNFQKKCFENNLPESDSYKQMIVVFDSILHKTRQ